MLISDPGSGGTAPCSPARRAALAPPAPWLLRAVPGAEIVAAQPPLSPALSLSSAGASIGRACLRRTRARHLPAVCSCLRHPARVSWLRPSGTTLTAASNPGCGQLHSRRGAQGQAYDIAAKCRRGLTQSEVYSTFEGLAAGRAQPFKLVWRRLRVNVLCARTECMWATLAAVWRA